MSELFLSAVNMSISASWLILAVLACRLVLRKAPKWVNVFLWGIVAARLLFPFSIESALSLIPSAETIRPGIMTDAVPTIDSGIPAINNTVNPVISQTFAPAPAAGANPLQIWIPVLAAVWAAGIAVLFAYTAVSYWRLRGKVDAAVLIRDNIFWSENVSSPFVLGVVKPKIYLPFQMDGQDMVHVVAHEQAHLRRGDHWWKPLGFLLLTVYWFNPLMWLAYVLLCRDIELACDEKVIKELGKEQRADYTQALLNCSAGRRMIAACPLAFGEVGVKERVKTVMKYKKPAFWIVVLAVMVCTIVAVCFLTDPVAADDTANKGGNNVEGTANKRENSVVKWFDYVEAPEELPWEGYLETNCPEFPDVTFRWSYGTVRAVTKTGTVELYTGMPVWSVYFYDLTGDGLPELCSTLSYGSGLIDNRVRVYDYANGVCYELEDRGTYDYTLRLDNEDGCLYVDKKIYDYFSNGSGELVSSGRLTFSGGYLHIVESSPPAQETGPVAPTGTPTEAPTGAPAEGFSLNADLLSELGMSYLQLSEKYGGVLGGFENTWNFGGYGRYAWKIVGYEWDYTVFEDMTTAGGCNWIDGVSPEELFSGVSYPISFEDLENRYGFIPISISDEATMSDLYWSEFRLPMYDNVTYIVGTWEYGLIDTNTSGVLSLNVDCREAQPLIVE